MKVVVLGTGGTIAGVADAAALRGYRAGQVGVDSLVLASALPQGCEVLTEQVAQVDSKDMQEALWIALARRAQHWLARPDVAGVVVTHGTDTLEETAFFLHSVLLLDKPLVLTGAMRPSTDAQADGPANLRDAIAVAASSRLQGVFAVFAGRVFAGAGVRKVHPRRDDAFESGDDGDIGRVGNGGLEMPLAQQPSPGRDAGRFAAALEKMALRLQAGRPLPWVAWVSSHAGSDGSDVRALLAAGVEGLAVGGTGNATVHRRLAAALDEARARGVPVAVGSRCSLGDAQAADEPAGAEEAGPALQPAKARIALQLRLLARDP